MSGSSERTDDRDVRMIDAWRVATKAFGSVKTRETGIIEASPS